MKKCILFFVFFVMTYAVTKAQFVEVPPEQVVASVKTTEDEFNYLTKYYKSYLPIRDGYKMENIETVTYALNSVDRIFNFKKFIRVETNDVAAILVEYVRVSKENTSIYYFCIPRANSSDAVWKIVQETIESLGSVEIRNAYIWSLTKYLSKNIN